MNESLVSIITPVLNGMKYLEICIQSVLNQSYPHIEHIFIDGGSKDGTLELLSKYQTNYPERIRYISEPDQGVGAAVNKGFKIARGSIFGWIDSDDIYELDAIKTVVDFFVENPRAYFLYGGCDIINENGEVISSFIIKDFNLHEAITRWHYIVLLAVFFRSDVIKRVGGLNPLGNDLDFYIRVYRQFQMHRIEKTLANWRMHSQNISLAPSVREKRIRKKRLREDFFLCLRNGGHIFSPRCKRYYQVLLRGVFIRLRPVIDGLRPVLGWAYPFLNKLWESPY